MKENNNLKQKSKLMIGLFSFLGIMMVFAIATTNLASKGTYSADCSIHYSATSCKSAGCNWDRVNEVCYGSTSSTPNSTPNSTSNSTPKPSATTNTTPKPSSTTNTNTTKPTASSTTKPTASASTSPTEEKKTCYCYACNNGEWKIQSSKTTTKDNCSCSGGQTSGWGAAPSKPDSCKSNSSPSGSSQTQEGNTCFEGDVKGKYDSNGQCVLDASCQQKYGMCISGIWNRDDCTCDNSNLGGDPSVLKNCFCNQCGNDGKWKYSTIDEETQAMCNKESCDGEITWGSPKTGTCESSFTPGCYEANNEYHWFTTKPASGWTQNNLLPGACSGCKDGYEYNEDEQCVPKTGTCSYTSLSSCKRANAGYNCYENPNMKGCYVRSSSACYACTKDSKTYYTYTNEGECPLADNYDRCADDTKGKNRLYLMQYDRSTGNTSTINVLECNYDAVEECKVNPGGTWFHEKECIRNVGNTTNVTINGDTTWWTCVGTPQGGEPGGDNPPASGTTPSNPSSPEKKTCYVCVSGEKSQYVWASSSANAASAATTLTGITSKNCATTSESNCSGIPVTNCYECNGSKKYVMADSDADAKSKSGGSNCTVVTTDKCNTVTPPATGTVGIIVAWIIGILTIGYSLWYFKKSSSLNK